MYTYCNIYQRLDENNDLFLFQQLHHYILLNSEVMVVLEGSHLLHFRNNKSA